MHSNIYAVWSYSVSMGFFSFAPLREEIFLWSWIGLWALLWTGYFVLYLYFTLCNISLNSSWEWGLYLICLHPPSASRAKTYIYNHFTKHFIAPGSLQTAFPGDVKQSDKTCTVMSANHIILQRTSSMLLVGDVCPKGWAVEGEVTTQKPSSLIPTMMGLRCHWVMPLPPGREGSTQTSINLTWGQVKNQQHACNIVQNHF